MTRNEGSTVDGITVAALIAAALMTWSAGHGYHPYSFYQFMRWVVSGSAVLGAWRFARYQHYTPTVALVLVAVLFNPVSPIHMRRWQWPPYDYLAAAVSVVTACWLFVLARYQRNDHQRQEAEPLWLDKVLPEKPGQHVFIAGDAGTGVRQFADVLIRHCLGRIASRVVFLDTTGDPDTSHDIHGYTNGTFRRCISFDEVKAAARKRERRIRFSPVGSADYGAFFEWAFEEGGVAIFVDEILRVEQTGELRKYYYVALGFGRENGVTVAPATEKPEESPPSVFWNSPRVVCFRLASEAARRQIAGRVPVDEDELANLGYGEFRLWSVGWKQPETHTIC